MKKHFFISLFAVFFVSFVKADLPEDIYFHTLSPSGGFYYDGISGLLHDDVGYIWIVMSNDVFRFDGQRHKRYSSKFEYKKDEEPISFRAIEMDDQGCIYVATTKGIYVYNQETDSFECVLSGGWHGVNKDTEGKLWFYNDHRIGFLDKEGQFVHIAPLSDDYTEKRFHARKDNVLVGTNKGKIYSVLPDKEVELFFEFPQDYSISDIESNDSVIWVLTNNKGLFAIDVKTRRQIKEYTFFATRKSELVPANALYLQEDNVWVGTQRGLYVIDTSDGSYVSYTYSKPNRFGIPNNSIWTIYEDKQHNLWIGTYAGGLCYVDFTGNERFKSYFYETTELTNNLISCFAEDDKFLWVGTEGGGVNRIDKKTGEFCHYTHAFNQPSLSYDNVKSLVLDSTGRLWIGMYQGGIDCFDQRKARFSNFRDNKQTNVKKIVLESDSGLWCANQSNQYISFLSFKSEHITHHKILKKGIVADMCRGKGNDLWVAKSDALLCVDISTMEVVSCLPEQENGLKIETIAMDSQGAVWIGTIDSGVLKYDPYAKSMSQYDQILKYGVYVIYSICFDNAGNPWLGTDNGLFKLDVRNGNFYQFDSNDGIQGMTFYPKSCMKGRDGVLYFGGMNGFTIVYPENVHINEFKPRVVISDFYVDGRLVTMEAEDSPLVKNIELTNEIVLNHRNENFGFRFFSNNYINLDKNRFKYRLKGYDREWIEVDASHNTVNYVKVPPGDYVFEVIAANNDGVWNMEPTCIRIKRLPSPFKTWWAYSCYLLLLVFVCLVIIRYYFRQKKLKMDLYLENMKAQQQDLAHQSQLRFFTNISHEFRTPLFLMIAALERLKKDNIDDKYFQLLTQNTHRLLTLINELMDFRTIENEQMKLNLVDSEINVFVDEIAKDFQFYAADQDISFSICKDCRLDAFSLCFDRKVMEKIVLNLLNNAFKFTDRGGKICIETYCNALDFKASYVDFYQEGRGITETDFCIVVRDTGVGISKESIADIFVRFYKVEPDNNLHMGSGIGLALVKSLVLLHKGTIRVYSERGKGSEFVVAFSKDKSVYDPKDFEKYAIEKAAIDESSLEFSEDFVSDGQSEESVKPDKFVTDFSARKRILLVEDNEDIRFAICDILSEYFDIIEASNGMEATERLNSGKDIDMVISDVMMPLKDGVTLCLELKADVNFSHIPFVMLTARSGMESRIEGVNSGADAYFEKPVNLKLLLLTIQNLFSQKQKLKDYYSKNYFVDSLELATNQQDNMFLGKLVEVIEQNIERSDIDVNYIASQLSMSRSKLYSKIKSMTDKSIVEFIRSYRLRKAAKLLAEENLPVNEVMMRVGIESDSYFAKSFKSEFGLTPSEFVKNIRKKQKMSF